MIFSEEMVLFLAVLAALLLGYAALARSKTIALLATTLVALTGLLAFAVWSAAQMTMPL